MGFIDTPIGANKLNILPNTVNPAPVVKIKEDNPTLTPIKPVAQRPIIERDDTASPPAIWKSKSNKPLEGFTAPAPVLPTPVITPEDVTARLSNERQGLNAIQQVKGYEQRSPLKDSGYTSAEEIKAVQRVLRDSGHDIGKYGKDKDGVDGILGANTKRELMKYNAGIKAQSGLVFTPEPKSNLVKGGTAKEVIEKQCSEYVVKELYRISNTKVPYSEFKTKTGLGGDAWLVDRDVISQGGQYVFNADDNIKRPGKVQIGDIANMFTGGGSAYQKTADLAVGKGPNKGYTHLGFVSKIYPDGSYDIDNNVHKKNKLTGEYIGQASVTHVTKRVDPKTGVVSWITDRGNSVKKIIRPKYDNVQGRPTLYDKDIKLAVPEGRPEETKIVNFYNANKQKIATNFKLDEDENAALSRAALGIIQQESKFGEAFDRKILGVNINTRQISEAVSSGIKNMPRTINANPGIDQPVYGVETEASRGLARIKYQMNFDRDELKFMNKDYGIKNEESPEGSFIATMAILNKNYSRFLHSGLSKEEALYRAIAAHNSPSKAASVGSFKGEKDYAKHYDIDYANKVVAHSLKYKTVKGEQQLGTLIEKLATNNDVLKNSGRINSFAQAAPAPSTIKPIKKASKGGLLRVSTKKKFTVGGKVTGTELKNRRKEELNPNYSHG